MKKILLAFISSFLITALGLFLIPKPAHAVDLTVTCDGTDCTMAPTSGAALFNESNWLPGDTVTRNLTVINNATEDDCDLVMNVDNPTQTPADFATKLWTVIKDGSNDLYGVRDGLDRATSNKTLNDLFLGNTVDYGVIAAGITEAFTWTVTFDFLAGNEYQLAQTWFDFDLSFACGEPSQDQPRLVLDKDNDRKGQLLGVNDVVTYEVTVRNLGPGTSFNTQVIDVQPTGEYFDYLESSGRLTCTSGGPIDAPVTASGTNPYIWNLGDMSPEELCTSTYQLKILSTSIPGIHNNIALAHGQDSRGQTIFSNTVLDPFDVGQKGELSGKLPVGGTVLGAATVGEVLGAATGSKTFWLILAAILIGAGFILRRVSKRASHLLVFFIVASSGLSLTPRPALAVDNDAPVVAIVQLPEYMNKSDFEISYTALDGGEAGLKNVHLELKKDGEGWNDLGTYAEESRKVSVAGKINSDAKYFFQATACDNNNNCAVSQTSTNVDTTAPPPPENYGKSKTGAGAYRLTWHNPDSDDLNWVYIYRSDKADFTADEGTKVGNVPAGKNTNGEFNDSGLDSQKEYYYALRNVDKAGNGSSLVGDIIVITTQTSPTSQVVTGQEAISGQVLTPQVVTLPAGGGEILGEQEATEAAETPQPETVTLPQPEATAGEVKGLSQALSGLPKWLLIAGGAGLLLLGTWFFTRKRE